MNQNDLSPEERKRMLAELKQDSAYAKSRTMLLVVSTLCASGLAMVGLLVSRDRLSMDLAFVSVGACVIAYFLMIISVVKARNAAEARWWMVRSRKKPKKKKGK